MLELKGQLRAFRILFSMASLRLGELPEKNSVDNYLHKSQRNGSASF